MINHTKIRKSLLQKLLIISLVFNALFAGVILSTQLKNLSIFKKKTVNTVTIQQKDKVKENLFDQINPVSGFQINAKFGDLGPKLLSSGAIDLEKFKAVYEKANQPLTPEQEDVLLKGSDDKIKITRDNSYFLLNFFWAVGLSNKSRILDEGDMMQYGGIGGAGNFASTGGWSLAKGNAMSYYSKSDLISLTKTQEELVDLVASNIYRPCCNNSTAFPDCNHGMALLGVLQLMAQNGATQEEMYKAGKYFNAFWFPGNYYDLALYFKNKENKKFKDIDAKLLLSKTYSSASGWQTAKSWLAEKGIIEQPPKTGGGCGT